MTPRTYESLETKLRRLAERAEEAGLKANIARVRICAAQQPEIIELNRAIEVIGLAEMEAESMGAELAAAQRSEAQEPSEAVRLQRMVRAHWVRFKFDPEEPECVRCGTSMYLRDGGEWEDREEYNLCHECALMVIHEMRSNVASERRAGENLKQHDKTTPSRCLHPSCSALVENDLTGDEIRKINSFGECWIRNFDHTKREQFKKALWLWAWDKRVIFSDGPNVADQATEGAAIRSSEAKKQSNSK